MLGQREDWLQKLWGVSKPLIGMLHVPPLPGSPGYAGNWSAVRDAVLRDGSILVSGGFHGLMLENYGDTPFFPGRVPAHVAASLASLATAVRREFDVPLGINVLRNDGQTALAVAVAAEAQFIRVNILCGTRLTDQGILTGIAHDLLRDRSMLHAEHIRIMADVNVKHSVPLASRPLADEVEDVLTRGGADALIVSGAATGKPVALDELQTVQRAAMSRAPVIAGSGVTTENLAVLLQHTDACIIGSSLKHEGQATNAVDPQRVSALVAAWRTAIRL